MKKINKILAGSASLLVGIPAHAGVIYNDVSSDLSGSFLTADHLSPATSSIVGSIGDVISSSEGGSEGGSYIDYMDFASLSLPNDSNPVFMDFAYDGDQATHSSVQVNYGKTSLFLGQVSFSVNGGSLYTLDYSSPGGYSEGSATTIDVNGSSEGYTTIGASGSLSTSDASYLNFFDDAHNLIFGFQFATHETISISMESPFGGLNQLVYGLESSYHPSFGSYRMDISSSLTQASVPEPGVLGLMAAGVGGLWGMGRRKRIARKQKDDK